VPYSQDLWGLYAWSHTGNRERERAAMGEVVMEARTSREANLVRLEGIPLLATSASLEAQRDHATIKD
jgi:hypothetical protein